MAGLHLRRGLCIFNKCAVNELQASEGLRVSGELCMGVVAKGGHEIIVSPSRPSCRRDMDAAGHRRYREDRLEIYCEGNDIIGFYCSGDAQHLSSHNGSENGSVVSLSTLQPSDPAEAYCLLVFHTLLHAHLLLAVSLVLVSSHLMVSVT